MPLWFLLLTIHGRIQLMTMTITRGTSIGNTQYEAKGRTLSPGYVCVYEMAEGRRINERPARVWSRSRSGVQL